MGNFSHNLIQKLKFDIELSDKEDYHILANKISQIVRFHLTDLMDQVLNEVGDPWLLYRFEKLVIDLGNIEEEEIEYILKNEVPEKLRNLILEKLRFRIDYTQKKVIPLLKHLGGAAGIAIPSGTKLPKDEKELKAFFKKHLEKKSENIILSSKQESFSKLSPKEILLKRLKKIEENKSQMFSSHIQKQEESLGDSKRNKKRTTQTEHSGSTYLKNNMESALRSEIKDQPLYVSTEKGEEIVVLANYSNQMDALVWFLKKGRLPHWLHLGDSSIRDLVNQLATEYPQILFSRLSQIVRENVIVLPRLLMQFEGDLLEKIQTKLLLDLGEVYEEQLALLTANITAESKLDQNDSVEITENKTSEPAIPDIVLEAAKEIESAFQSPKKQTPIFEISELRLAFLTHFILYGKEPFWMDNLPEMTYDKMAWEEMPYLTRRLKKIMLQYTEAPTVENLVSGFSTETLQKLIQNLEPDFAGFVQTVIMAIRRWEGIVNPEKIGWRLVYSYLFRMKEFNVNVFLSTFLEDFSKIVGMSREMVSSKIFQIAKTEIERGERRFSALNAILEQSQKSPFLSWDETKKMNMPNYEIIDLFEYFLRKGNIPGDYGIDKTIFENQLIELIRDRPKTVKELLRNIPGSQLLENKALGNLSDAVFEHLLKILMPIRGGTMIKDFLVLRQLPERAFVGAHALFYATNTKEEHYSRHHYLRGFIKNKVRQEITDPKKIISEILIDLKGESAKNIIQHLQILENAVKTSKTLKQKTERETRQKEEIFNKTEKIRVPYKFRNGELLEPIYIRNSGTVLLWPFLGHYFNKLDMLTSDKQWKSEADSNRAVHLLQYLATSQTAAEEHELVLNKLLCGIPIDTPIKYGITLTEKEKDLSESLLRAVIGQWKAIGQASVDGLRGSFLIRSGRLVKKEDRKWTLTVEKKPYDILLGKLPWSYSMIKASWMDCIILVDWT